MRLKTQQQLGPETTRRCCHDLAERYQKGDHSSRYFSGCTNVLGARSFHFHRCRHCPTSDNSIGCKPEVYTVFKTGSTNKLATETVCLSKLLLFPVWISLCTSGLHWVYVYVVFRRIVITTSGTRPPWRKCRLRLAHIPVKNLHPKIGITIEIAFIGLYVSVAKLLILLVWGTVSTSGLYLLVFSIVSRSRRRWKWIGLSRKLCRNLWDHV